MSFGSFRKGAASKTGFTTGMVDSKYVTAAQSLPSEATVFVPLFETCEKSRNSVKGTYLDKVVLVKHDTIYSPATLHISLTYKHLCDIIDEDNVKQLLAHYENFTNVINFPFSDLSSDDADRIVIKCKSAHEHIPVKEGESAGVVIIPMAYKAGGGIKKAGISFRIAAFVI